jgi:hypothetical protein
MDNDHSFYGQRLFCSLGMKLLAISEYWGLQQLLKLRRVLKKQTILGLEKVNFT